MSGSVTWDVLGASVRGATHTRNKAPNQDAIAWYAPAHREDCLILAISDGHGAPRYVRSHKGAKLAVKLAVELLQEFAADENAIEELSLLPDHADGRLPRTLVRSWQSAVRHDIAAHPFTAAEELILDQHQRNDDDGRVRAYGATLLAALITQHYLLLLQLGDGDILIVDNAGRVARPPMPLDPRLIANQTTSLCGPTAWTDMRAYFQAFSTRPPALVMLATDGYFNSFANESGFTAAATDILEAIRTQGSHQTRIQLPGWLRATSKAGSGDDISVAIAYSVYRV
jgi:serine/threonine protein phosphatase PrpC